METTTDLQQLSFDEMIECNAGGFAYDVGSVIGFLIRYAQGPVGQLNAYVVWYYQHP